MKHKIIVCGVFVISFFLMGLILSSVASATGVIVGTLEFLAMLAVSFLVAYLIALGTHRKLRRTAS